MAEGAAPKLSGWSWFSSGKGTPTWRVMRSCREKGSSVSRSRKFLALMFSCSTAYSQEGAHCYCARPQPWQCEPGTRSDGATIPEVRKRGANQRAHSSGPARDALGPSQRGSLQDTPMTHTQTACM